MRLRIYVEPRDRWIGYYRGDTHHYVCPLPCVVIRWPQRSKPGCCCLRCGPPFRDNMQGDWRDRPFVSWMSLCPTCGNKRCPGAVDHRRACSGSNEPGQPGSAYE